MVAGGVALAVPFGQLVAEAWRNSTTSQGPAVGGVIDTAAMPPPGASPALAAAAPREWLVPDESLPPPITPRPDYTPPSPPDQLPPVSRAAAADASGFNATYRSTLEVPPPPLLDAHAAPPPVVAWMDPRSPAPAAVSPPLAAQGVPATYRVRDGDDLTGIATRFYGHAGHSGRPTATCFPTRTCSRSVRNCGCRRRGPFKACRRSPPLACGRSSPRRPLLRPVPSRPCRSLRPPGSTASRRPIRLRPQPRGEPCGSPPAKRSKRWRNGSTAIAGRRLASGRQIGTGCGAPIS